MFFIKWKEKLEDPIMVEYFEQFKEKMTERPEVKKWRYNWWVMSRYVSNFYNEFEKNKTLKEKYEKKLKDLIELKQSILKEAFEGRLVKE